MAHPATMTAATERTPLLPSASSPLLTWLDYCWILPPLFSNIFLSNFENTIAASVQNPIGSSFDAGRNVAWVATSYLIVSTAVQPLYGRFSGIFGRTPVYIFALTTFSVGCLGCGFSQNLLQLVMFRAFCGLGGGGLITISQIIAYDFIPLKSRGLYQAMTNSSYGLGGALGASIGGTIAETLGWRYAFFLQIPLCVLSLMVYLLKARTKLAKLGIPMKSELKFRDIDIVGSILLMSCITSVLLGVNLGGTVIPWSHPLIPIFFSAAALLLATFVWHEKSFSLPVLPLSLFRGRVVLAHLGANFFGAAAVFSTFYLLPTFFQAKLRNSVMQASARLIYPTLSAPIGSVGTGVLLNLAGPHLTQPLAMVGAFVLMLGTSMDLGMQFEDALYRPEAWYVAHICWTNLGMGILFPASLIDMSGRPVHDQAITTSLIFLTRSLGSVFGISVSQSILQNVLSRSLANALPKDSLDVIDKVRNDIEAIAELAPFLQAIVIECYGIALQAAFGFCAAAGLCTFVSILFSWTRRERH